MQLPLEYALSCFLAGLEDEIQLNVRMFHPQNISQAFSLAKLQEAALRAKRSRVPSKPPMLQSSSNFSQKASTPRPKPLLDKLKTQVTTNLRKPYPSNTYRRTLSLAEFDDRKSKGLFYFCDEKYTPGHICKGKKPQFYHIEIEEEEEDDEPFAIINENIETEFAQISVNALAGDDVYQTMRVSGHCGKKEIQILMDFESLHNFIDEALAKRLGCKILPRAPMTVKVANGELLVCDTFVKGFTWKMQGVDFKADVNLIPLGVCDLVLGVQWFTTTLGSIKLNYQDNTIEFKFLDKKVILREAIKDYR